MTEQNTAPDNPKKDGINQNAGHIVLNSDPKEINEILNGESDTLTNRKTVKIIRNEQIKSKKRNLIKKAKSPKEKSTAKHSFLPTEQLVKWTILVQEETKTAVGKAINKANISVAEWMDSRLRQVATDELTQKPKPPAKVEDVTDLIKKIADELKQGQEAAQSTQTAMIQQQGQQIDALTKIIESNRPKSLKERIFGRSKED